MKTKQLCGPLFVLLLSCDAENGTTDAGPELVPSRATVLAHLGEHVILPSYRDVVPALEALVDDLDAYATEPTAVHRSAAQAAWRAAMDRWQAVELMQIGPLASMGESPGGTDLRDEIYPWPSLNLCVVDQRTVGDTHDDPAALGASP